MYHIYLLLFFSNVTFNYLETSPAGLLNEGAGDIINGGYYNSPTDFNTGNDNGLGTTDILKINVATSNENAKLQKSEVNKVESSDEKKENKDKKDEILLENKKSISENKKINKKDPEKIESIKKAGTKSDTKIKKEESDLEKDIKKKDK